MDGAAIERKENWFQLHPSKTPPYSCLVIHQKCLPLTADADKWQGIEFRPGINGTYSIVAASTMCQLSFLSSSHTTWPADMHMLTDSWMCTTTVNVHAHWQSDVHTTAIMHAH
eukprot:136720-Pelagomonas_calceolata.AAC.7